MKVAFLTNDLGLSGGIGVVVAHARRLHDDHGFDVWLVVARESEATWDHPALNGLKVADLHEARGEHFDVAISTWWETAFDLFELPADRYASFVQSFEDRFYRPGELEQVGASLVLDLPVAFITEARWIHDTLHVLRPDASCRYVRNAIDHEIFTPVERVEPNLDRPLRILVEGYATTWFKGVNEAVEACLAMEQPHELTVVAPTQRGLDTRGVERVLGPIPQAELAQLYRETDVVLKLSRVEGMYGPPLEGFCGGATCVTTEVTGADEYIEHGVNALVVDWDDERGTARALDLLARDRRLLHRLRSNALETARTWPTWERSGDLMASALRQIHEEPVPDPYATAGRLMGDLRTHLHALKAQDKQRRLLEWRFKRLGNLPGVRQGVELHGSPGGQFLLKLVHPLTKRVKARLLGS